MRISQNISFKHRQESVSVRVERMFIYLTAFGFLSIAGIYLLFI